MFAGRREWECASRHGALPHPGGQEDEGEPLGRAQRVEHDHQRDTDSRAAVDETMRKAVAAGGGMVRQADPAPWSGYFGYFADPDGYLWKVTTYVS